MAIRTRVNGLWPTRVMKQRTATGSWTDLEVPSLSETFSGGNAATWPVDTWTTVITPVGGGASVSSGVGQLTTGSNGGYSGADFVGVRANSQLADMDLSFSFTFPDQDVTGVDLVMRTDATLDRGTSVVVELRRDRIRISSLSDWTSTQHASADHWLTPGVVYRAHVSACAGSVKARVWPAASNEPETWVEGTETPRVISGYWGLIAPNGFTPGAMVVTIDNLEVKRPQTRYALAEPFSSTSLWNTPIGTDATYSPLTLTAPPMFGDSATYIVLDKAAPQRKLIDRGFYYEWSGGVWRDGTSVLGTDTGVRVQFPDSYLIPAPPNGSMPDRTSVAISSTGNLREFQYTVRPTVGSDLSIYESARAEYDPVDDGKTMLIGSSGGHGGSGLTALGGALRIAEVGGGAPIRHALSFTFNLTRWGTKSGGGIVNGYRWPALWADSLYSSTSPGVGYGTLGETPRSGLGSGSLLAIPATIDLSTIGLETALGQRLAWTCQNYGGYVTDNTGETADWQIWQINAEVGLSDTLSVGSVATPATNTAYGRDMARIYTRLAVVSNNSQTSIGGGGVPLQPFSRPVAALPA